MLRACYNAQGRIRQSGRGPGGQGNGRVSEVADAWNPAMTGSTGTLSNSNLTGQIVGGEGDWILGSSVKTGGKLYFELVVDAKTNFHCVGIVDSTHGYENVGISGTEACRYPNQLTWTLAGTAAATNFALNDVMGFAVDIPNKTIDLYKNNVLETSRTWATYSSIRIGMCGNAAGTSRYTMRTKAADFTYTPPTGYSSWASGN